MLIILITKYRYQHLVQPKSRMRWCGVHTRGSEGRTLTYLEMLS